MFITLTVLSYLLFVLVFLPLIRNNYWVFRSLEYPRFQKFVINLLILCGWGIYYHLHHVINYYAAGLVAINLIYLAVKIYSYSIFAPKAVQTLTSSNQGRDLKILSANIYQDNRQYQRLLDQIRETNPDVILLLETDAAWEAGVSELEKTYPYTLKAPKSNTYGLLFYSRFELSFASVNYLVKEDIPSVEAVIQLPSGVKVKLWGLHPEPPVPGENLYSTAKDKELMKIALKAAECELPCIVMGDLNDVAWSYTTTLFGKVSKLLDVRKGRGFYSTFSANHWYLRFPLDYIFCSASFGLVEMKRLGYNGSDHFPIFTHFVYNKALDNIQEAPEADHSDQDEAKEIAAQQLDPEEL
jgi:endonuclease/exonuclease/phosphatase (EEP) superfamily protein YafD